MVPMSRHNGPRPSTTPQLTTNVVLLPESDQRSPLVTTAQLDALRALLEVTA